MIDGMHKISNPQDPGGMETRDGEIRVKAGRIPPEEKAKARRRVNPSRAKDGKMAITLGRADNGLATNGKRRNKRVVLRMRKALAA